MCALSELWDDSSGITLPDVIATSCLAVEEEKHWFLSTFTVHDSAPSVQSVYLWHPTAYTNVYVCACGSVMWNMMTDYLTGLDYLFCKQMVPVTLLLHCASAHSADIFIIWLSDPWRLFSSKSFPRLLPVLLNRQTCYFLILAGPQIQFSSKQLSFLFD